MAGTLYLCATPIGNLEDITYRVLRTLKEVDLIAAEDTRNSIKLLNHFEIKTPMTSYHEYNKIEKAYQLIDKMREGKNIALITDAGTPGISDPGEDLVRICYEEGIEVTSLPGAAASGGGLPRGRHHTWWSAAIPAPVHQQRRAGTCRYACGGGWPACPDPGRRAGQRTPGAVCPSGAAWSGRWLRRSDDRCRPASGRRRPGRSAHRRRSAVPACRRCTPRRSG